MEVILSILFIPSSIKLPVYYEMIDSFINLILYKYFLTKLLVQNHSYLFHLHLFKITSLISKYIHSHFVLSKLDRHGSMGSLPPTNCFIGIPLSKTKNNSKFVIYCFTNFTK